MNRKEFLFALGVGSLAMTRNATASIAIRSVKPPLPHRAVIPAAVTAVDEAGQLDIADFKRHIRALADVPGVSAIMVNGAAGHDNTLNRDERRRLLGEALKITGARVPIMAALRETSSETTLAPFARDAEAEGAHAMVIMPLADKSTHSWEGAKARFDSACSASSLPVAIYQTSYNTETLARLAALPPVFAVKDGSGSPSAFQRNLRSLRALDRNVAIWSTHSSWLLADLALGADGILSGMGSLAADLHVALAEAVWRSDLAAARKVNERIFPLAQAFYRPGQDAHVRMKYALKRLGRQQHDTVRPPLKPLDAEERAVIDRALKEAGLL